MHCRSFSVLDKIYNIWKTVVFCPPLWKSCRRPCIWVFSDLSNADLPIKYVPSYQKLTRVVNWHGLNLRIIWLGRYELIIRFSSEKLTRKGTDGRFILCIYIRNNFKIRPIFGRNLPKDVRQVAMHNTFVHQSNYVHYFVAFTTKITPWLSYNYYSITCFMSNEIW